MTKPTRTIVFGRDLRVGDTIECWWKGGLDTITALRPYTGRLASSTLDGRPPVFRDGAQLADLLLLSVGMTIDNGDTYTVVSRQPTAKRHYQVVNHG